MLLNSPEFSNFVAWVVWVSFFLTRLRVSWVFKSRISSRASIPVLRRKAKTEQFHLEMEKKAVRAQTRRILIFNHSRPEVAEAITVKCY